MSHSPLVSVLISAVPAGSAGNGLSGCLDSLSAQTLAPGDLEILVAVGPSSQPEIDLVRSLNAPVVPTLVETDATAPGLIWNGLTALASGRYIHVADPADRLHPEGLAELVAAAEASSAAIVYADAVFTDDLSVPFADSRPELVWTLPDFSMRQAVMDNLFGPAVLMRTERLRALGGFNGQLATCVGYELLLRLALDSQNSGTPVVRLPLPLVLRVTGEDRPETGLGQTSTEAYTFLPAFRQKLALDQLYPFLNQDSSEADQLAAIVDYADLLLFSGGGFSDPIHASELYVHCLRQGHQTFQTVTNTGLALAKIGEVQGATEFLQAAQTLDDAVAEVAAHNLEAVGAGKTYKEYVYVRAEYPAIQALPPVTPRSAWLGSPEDYLNANPAARRFMPSAVRPPLA